MIRLRRRAEDEARGDMKKRRGYTLVEIVVALLLSCVMISAVFTIALTAKQSTGVSERRQAAAQATQALLQNLKAYVADPNYVVSGDSDILGPCPAGNARATWSLNCRGITDSRGSNAWALADGNHGVTGILPPWFVAAPYGATLNYSVSPGGFGGQQRQVSVTVSWNGGP